MAKYLIERNVPGAHQMTAEDRQAGARTSSDVLEQLGPGIEWEQSFITEDRITCVYIADNEELIREHARRSGFPADAIRKVEAGMDPGTARAGREATTAV